MKRPSMSAALSSAAGKPTAAPARGGVVKSIMESLPMQPVADPEPPKKKQPSREGKRNMSVHVDEAVHLQFTITALKLGMKNEHAMREAINLWFELHGQPPIA